MDREIRCYECDIYLGCIRDAKLKKNIYFVCYECASNKQSKPPIDMPDIFKDIFGGKI